MHHPLLKSALWAVAGIVLQASVTAPGKASKKDVRRQEDTVMSLFVQYGSAMFMILSWFLTAFEIMTVQSSWFRRITSFPNSYDAATIDAPFLASLTLLVVFGILRMSCYLALGNLFTYEVTIRPNHKLITSGPYGFVRHPSYTAYIGVVLANMSLHFSVSESWAVKRFFWLWALHACAAGYKLVTRTDGEDEILGKTFGEEWVSYRERVQYRFVPGIL